MLIIAFLACLTGLVVSIYMYRTKSRHQKLFCPRDNPCDVVTHSHFGSTLGIKNEALGVSYFLVVLIILKVLAVHILVSGFFFLAFKALLIVGGLFSIYLLIIQALILRKWCHWCLLVAVSNFVLIAVIFSILG